MGLRAPRPRPKERMDRHCPARSDKILWRLASVTIAAFLERVVTGGKSKWTDLADDELDLEASEDVTTEPVEVAQSSSGSDGRGASRPRAKTRRSPS